jgi:hypothetical protein
MLKDLVKVANRLDSLGLTREADAIDTIIVTSSMFDDDNQFDSVYEEPERPRIEEQNIVNMIQSKNKDIKVLAADWTVNIVSGIPEGKYEITYTRDDNLLIGDCQVVMYETDMPIVGYDREVYYLECNF